MDWLWRLYEQHIEREITRLSLDSHQETIRDVFMRALQNSTATLYVMEPVGDSIRFRGLGRFSVLDVPDLIADPNRYISERYGGGKYKVNFHDGLTFVGTHNFRTYGDELWRKLEEVVFE